MVTHFHARRAHRHARHRQALEVVALGQQAHLLGRHVAFDELAVDHPSMARRQAWRHAQALLDLAHVRLDMVVDGKAVVAQMADPGFAATTVGVAVDVDGLGSLGQASDGQQAQGQQVFAQHG